MKIILTKYLFVLLFFVLNINYSQEVISEVIYKKQATIDMSKKEKSIASDLLAKSFSEMEKIDYKLIFDNTQSYFKESSSMVTDDGRNPLSKTMSKMLGGGNDIFYMNLKTKKIVCQKELSSEYFIIESLISKYDWKTSNETKKIGKYLCYKASTKISMQTVKGLVDKNAVAWYTPAIPKSFGPIGYGGLPGLILELNIGNFAYYAKTIKLNNKKKLKIKVPTKGIKITEEEFYEMSKKGFEKYKR